MHITHIVIHNKHAHTHSAHMKMHHHHHHHHHHYHTRYTESLGAPPKAKDRLHRELLSFLPRTKFRSDLVERSGAPLPIYFPAFLLLSQLRGGWRAQCAPDKGKIMGPDTRGPKESPQQGPVIKALVFLRSLLNESSLFSVDFCVPSFYFPLCSRWTGKQGRDNPAKFKGKSTSENRGKGKIRPQMFMHGGFFKSESEIDRFFFIFISCGIVFLRIVINWMRPRA